MVITRLSPGKVELWRKAARALHPPLLPPSTTMTRQPKTPAKRSSRLRDEKRTPLSPSLSHGMSNLSLGGESPSKTESKRGKSKSKSKSTYKTKTIDMTVKTKLGDGDDSNPFIDRSDIPRVDIGQLKVFNLRRVNLFSKKGTVYRLLPTVGVSRSSSKRHFRTLNDVHVELVVCHGIGQSPAQIYTHNN